MAWRKDILTSLWCFCFVDCEIYKICVVTFGLNRETCIYGNDGRFYNRLSSFIISILVLLRHSYLIIFYLFRFS